MGGTGYNETVSADNLLSFGVPYKKLLVSLLSQIFIVYINSRTSSAACIAKREFAQTSQFLHDVRTVLGCDNVDFVITVVGLAEQLLLS